jgi:hypothetical protein
MWTLAYGQHEDRTPTHGYEAAREAAMAAFAKSWRIGANLLRGSSSTDCSCVRPMSRRGRRDVSRPPQLAASSLQELQNFLVFVAGGLPIAKYKPQGFAGRAAVSIQTIAHHFLAKVLECAMAAVLEGVPRRGGCNGHQNPE